MRTIISHFFNEEYLLPYWLKHHVPLFDHGILIDHGSTDASLDICHELAPHWRIVRSRLTNFDAYMTDFEVMTYESDLPGWKIVLNTTEFLLSPVPLADIEKSIQDLSKVGCKFTGMIVVDDKPGHALDPHIPLPLQKHWVIDDNNLKDVAVRKSIGLQSYPLRNRFYHSLPTGMYRTGRHLSFHRDSVTRLSNVFILHFEYAPWNEATINRKLALAKRILPEDLRHGWGDQHTKSREEFEANFLLKQQYATTDFSKHPIGMKTLEKLRNTNL